MTFEVPEKYSATVQRIMANLPTSQFIIDLVGEGIQIALSHFEDDDIERRLNVAERMSVYSKEVSQPLYYMTHLVLAPLVAGLEATEISKLDTASGVLAKAVVPLGSFVTSKEFKSKWTALFNLSSVDKDVMAAAFMFAKADVEKAMSEKDLYKLAGYGYIEVNIRQSGMFVNHTVRKFYNEFAALVLNTARF